MFKIVFVVIFLLVSSVSLAGGTEEKSHRSHNQAAQSDHGHVVSGHGHKKGVGIIVLKGQKFRTQEKNRTDTVERLKEIIKAVLVIKKARRPTKPTQRSQTKRLDNKTAHSKLKALRRNSPSSS